MQRCQDLPPSAFVTPKCAVQMYEDLMTSQSQATIGLGVISRSGHSALMSKTLIAVSYPWLTASHPDRDGYHVRTLIRYLKQLLKAGLTHLPHGDAGVFVDFMSLPQRSDLSERSESETAIFKAGLSCMHAVYSHQKIIVLQLKDAPGRDYDQSGWCLFEQSVSSIFKDSARLLNLSAVDWNDVSPSASIRFGARRSEATTENVRVKLTEIEREARATRQPPLSPEAFNRRLSKATFTNGADCQVVKEMYSSFYREVVPQLQTLTLDAPFGHGSTRTGAGGANKLACADWGTSDDAVVALAEVLPDFICLRRLSLQNHNFRGEHLKQLLAALEQMPELREVDLTGGTRSMDEEDARSLFAFIETNSGVTFIGADRLLQPHVSVRL